MLLSSSHRIRSGVTRQGMTPSKSKLHHHPRPHQQGVKPMGVSTSLDMNGLRGMRKRTGLREIATRTGWGDGETPLPLALRRRDVTSGDRKHAADSKTHSKTQE